MKKNYRKLIKALGKERVMYDQLLADYTSFKIGGPADLFFRAQTKADLISAVFHSSKLNIPFFLLGGGTNILVSDKGFRGIVIRNETRSIKLHGVTGKKGKDKHKDSSLSIYEVYIEVESGVSINRLVRFVLDEGLSGIECFLGQPGTVGGAVYINAHNMSQKKFFSDVVFLAKLLSDEKKERIVPSRYFKFGYDKSRIQQTGEIVLSVTVRLKRGSKQKLWQKAAEALSQRQATQPKNPSAGCIFKNIKKSDALRIATANYTTSAGYLLDSLRLKDIKRGGAMFAKEHANFIVNCGDAKAFHVIELIKLAKRRAKKKYGVDLKEEIVYVGDFKDV